MATYTVYMAMVHDHDMAMGTFNTATEAIIQAFQAKALGFECAIWVNKPNKESMYLCSVKPQ